MGPVSVAAKTWNPLAVVHRQVLPHVISFMNFTHLEGRRLGEWPILALHWMCIVVLAPVS